MLALVAPAGPGTPPVPAVHGCSLLADAGIQLEAGSGVTSPVGPQFDSGLVAVRETTTSALVVSPPAGSVAGSSLRHGADGAAALLDTVLPLGRQHVLWKAIPLLTDELALPSPRASPRPVKVAAVVLLVDPNGSILLTRRAASMRSYPGCWVLPGGAVDPGETVAAAAAREVAEETSLVVSPGALRPLACWESAFPLSPAGFAAARGLKAHVLMAAFVAAVPEAAPAVKCNPEEVDIACWVGADDIAPLLDGTLATSHTNCCSTSAGSGGIGAAQLVGVYPNDLTPPEGLGLAHHFVLHTWLAAGRPCAPEAA
jgi:8-oxo-dGTP pyrophosphatase MutT (NUDIX family)